MLLVGKFAFGAVALLRSGRNGAGHAGTPVARQRTADKVRNLGGRLCLISIHHEGYQLARRQRPLHILRNHDVDNDERRRGQASCKFLALCPSDDNVEVNCSCGSPASAACRPPACTLSLRMHEEETVCKRPTHTCSVLTRTPLHCEGVHFHSLELPARHMHLSRSSWHHAATRQTSHSAPALSEVTAR
jgi:hypothetical protein